jgi:hypothetical protein
MNTNKQTGEETMNESYKDKFNAQMKKAGIDSLGDLKTDAEKKAFFKAVDAAHTAKNESMTEELMSIAEETINEMKEGGKGSGPQMKPGAGTRKGSAADGGQTDDESDDYDSEMSEMMKEMASEMKMLKAETDPTKCEMMKKEMMMKAMKKMPEMSEMMKKEMMKKMNEYGSMNAMKEELTAGQKKLPPALQKAIAAKQGKKKEETKDADELEEKHVPGHNDTTEMSVGEIYAQAITKMNAMRKTRTTEMMNTMKTDEFDMAPNPEKLTAMIKDPMKSKEENPKRDLNATYMKSDVRADVKNGGGADMSKVQDAPKMMAAMKKINAMYKTEKYHETKSGSIHDVVAQMQMNEQKSVSIKVQEFSSLVETYLAKGGVVGNISEAVKQVELNKSLRMNELREFITTYNLHFLTNYVAEEFIIKE